MSGDDPKALVKEDKAVAQSDDDGGQTQPRSRLSWLVGWVLVPGAIIGVLFGGGVAVGAHFHESWFTRMIVWVIELFV